MERTISNFYQYQNINQHEEVAKVVTTINENLSQFNEDAKKFNSREQLFDLEMTDYTKIQTMIKEFQPYSNLWLTATGWFKNIVSWMNDEWETLDAESAEKFVEDAIKTLAISNRFFKERDILPILKIGE